MEAAYEQNPPSIPYQAFAPENFRKIIQRQIDTSIDTQLNAIIKLNPGMTDGSFSGNIPGNIITLTNEFGLRYFIVGRTRVGEPAVAAP